MRNSDRSLKAKELEKYRESQLCRHELRTWYQTPLGKALAEKETEELEAVLPSLFGYHLLQTSLHIDSSYLAKSMIRHKIIVDIDNKNLSGSLNMHSDASNLAIASDSIDVAILHHTLDVDIAPHQVLREADRVLVPEGRVIILGFNPWSSWGVRHVVNLCYGRCPWKLRFLSPSRIKDWLVLLGFEIEEVKTFFYHPPISSPLLIKKTPTFEKMGSKLWPAFGGTYLLVARKQVSTLTQIRPRWFLKRRPSVTPGFIETRSEK